MHGNVCILTESRSFTVFSGRIFRKCGHTFPIWTSGSADPAQKLLPHQHSRSPYTSWKYSAFRGLFDTSFSKNSLKPSSNTSRKSGVTPPHIHGYQIIFLRPSRSLVPWNVTYWVTFWPQKPSLLKGKKENSDFYVGCSFRSSWSGFISVITFSTASLSVISRAIYRAFVTAEPSATPL